MPSGVNKREGVRGRWTEVGEPSASQRRTDAPTAGEPTEEADRGSQAETDARASSVSAWFEAIALDDVVLAGIDWGGALAFDWAVRHPGRVRGVAFMETIIRPMS